MTVSRHGQLSGKPFRMILSKVWNAIVRATAALLLLATFVTPALAEISCAEESIVHLQDSVASAATDDHAVAPEPAQPGGDEKGGQAGHCSFSHGHCAGIPAGSARSEQHVSPSNEYTRVTAKPLPASSLDAPERPPSA